MIVPQVSHAQVADPQLSTTFQQFTKGDTDFKLNSASRVVLSADDPDLITTLNDPRGWLQKLRYASGFQLEIVVAKDAGKNDILLSNTPDESFFDAAASVVVDTNPGQADNVSRSNEGNILREGYQYNASENGLTIKFNEAQGALRGFQTLATLLMNDGNAPGQHNTIIGGTGLDFPTYENRRIMLDVARQFMPVDQLIGYMDKMSLHKLNELHIHLNDSAEGPDGVKRGYFRLFSDKYPGLVPPDGKYYTQDDWKKLEAAASRYGVEIIPEFDTPGHSMAFLNDNPNLPKVSGNNDGIDTSNPGPVVDYIAGVINEFRPWFKSETIHIGGDEVFNGNNNDRVTYLNALYDRLVQSSTNPNGFKNFWVWYDGPDAPVDDLNKNIGIEHWINDIGTGRGGRDKWIDIQNNNFYFVPQVQWFQRTGLEPSDAYQFYIDRLKQFVKDGNPAPDGMGFAVWNDITLKRELGVDYINAGMQKSLPGMGLINWRGVVRNADGSIVPYADLHLEDQIKASQEVSSFWIRDRFAYMNGGQALEVLMDTARHRFIYKDPVTWNKDYLTSNGPADQDWMAWDEADMAKAMRGPVNFHQTMFVAELAGEGNSMVTQPGWTCRDVGFALGEKTRSSCDADTWSNDITDESGAAKARIDAWNLRKVALGIENATSADEILSGVTEATLSAIPAARKLIKSVFDAATNTRDDYFKPSGQLGDALTAVDADPVAKEIYRRFLNVSFENRYWQFYGSGAAKYAEFLAATSDGKLAEVIAVERVGPVIAEYDATQPVIDALSTKTYTPGGLSKLGPGSLRLTGDSTYSGDTLVNGGLLAVDGSIVSTVTVNSAGTLGGVGRVGALVAKDGGWVSPGNSIGTLSVSGDAKLEKGSGLLVEVDGDGNSDKLAVDGKATLLGGVVMVIPEVPVLTQAVMDTLVGQTYTILTAAGGVEGTFAGAQSYYTFIGADLAYHPGDVTLTLNRVAFADVGRTFNQQETASGIESLGAGNPIYDAILASTIDDDPASTFAALSGDIHASLKGVLIEDGRIVRDAASARVRATLGGIVTTTAATDASNDTGIAPTNWAQAYGSWASIGSDGNAAELDRKIGGFLTGTDGFIANDWRLGFLVGYANTALFGAASSANIDSYQIGVYGGTRWDAIGLSFGAAYARHDIDTTRSVAGYSAQANYGGDSVQIFGEAGYTIDTAFAVLEPFVGAAYMHLSTDGFAETNSGPYGLSGSGSSTDVTTTTLGLRASHHFSLGGTRATASGMIGWRHAVGHVTPEAALAFKGGNIFVNRGSPMAKDALVFEAGFDVDLATNAKLGLSHNGQIGNGFNAHTVKTNLTIKF
ncbi:autotransporter domain-containing protein [Mesorhizobium humile]|uniref:beta-N-acetylhexosaminidase n=1 Tax=Mesorhizobium humile TaxID=3072313 RepID=A0ABU4YUZ5_9HYPH|nr:MULTISPECIES: autotransporter domain-containing protein [unclassified Mesorhizobium]MDX8457634.1 autotransporter domain-containing protein [Mesorhizobium sp. VK2D]MDX8489905.1 autotransporter domain-containing protein [Mesorhizobium sp. VK2B]